MGDPGTVANENAGGNAGDADAPAADSSTGVLPGGQGLESENFIGSSVVLGNGVGRANYA